MGSPLHPLVLFAVCYIALPYLYEHVISYEPTQSNMRISPKNSPFIRFGHSFRAESLGDKEIGAASFRLAGRCSSLMKTMGTTHSTGTQREASTGLMYGPAFMTEDFIN